MSILTGQAITAGLNPAALGFQFATVPAGTYTIGAGNGSDTLPFGQVRVVNPVVMATTEVTNQTFADGLKQLEGRDTVLMALWPGDRIRLVARGKRMDVEAMSVADLRDAVERFVNLADLRGLKGGFQAFNLDSILEQVVGIGPVTLAHCLDVMREAFWGGKKPVIGMTWFEAVAFAALFGWRLPTEVEWEIAARGSRGLEYGTSTGELYDAQGRKLAHFEEISTADVGSYPANEFGLYDMAGNVWEWTSSLYREGEPHRVIRGGSWSYGPQGLRAAFRFNLDPGDRSYLIGFRVASAPQDSQK